MKEILDKICQEYFGRQIDNYFIPRKSTNDVCIVDIGERKYCIKISSTDYTAAFRAEPFIQKKVFEETSIPVPEVLEVDYDREVISRDYFIMEYRKGKNAEDYDLDLSERSIFQDMRNEYSKLSNFSFDTFGYFHWSEEKCLEVFPDYEEWISMLSNEVKIMTDNMKKGRFRYLSDFHKRFYENEKSVLNSYNPAPNVVNSDYRLANILIEDEKLSTVVDWGSCFCGDLNFGIKKMEFLIDNPTTEQQTNSVIIEEDRKLTKFYESLMWMYIMSGFESWFSGCSEEVKGRYEQKIRDNYKKSIKDYRKI